MTREELIKELLESGEPRAEYGWDKAINAVLEIIEQETENIANGLCDVSEAYENVVNGVYALIEDETK